MDLPPSVRYVTAKNVRQRELDDEIVVFHPDTDQAQLLDRVGTIIWHVLAEPVTARQLVGRVAETFGLAPADIEADVLALVDTLVAESLVKPVESDAPPPSH